jgi:hypothetical protein
MAADEFLELIGHPPQLTYAIQDVSDYLKRSDLDRFDEIYHLASVVGPAGVLPHAGRTFANPFSCA